MPKVSVIVPVYNVEPYLRRCLDSLINQTLKEIEIICINDCSTDDSLNILNEYAQKDKRIKVINFEKNQGVSTARNAGIETAKGEYIGFVDSDDYVDLDFYEMLYNKAAETKPDIIKGNAYEYYMNGIESVYPINNIMHKSKNKFDYTYYFWTSIYKSSFIRQYNIKFPVECPVGEDGVFLIKCLINSKSMDIVDDVFYHYIRREGSLDSIKVPFRHVKSTILASKLILTELNNSNLYETNEHIYLTCFVKHINHVINGYFQSMDEESRKLCIESLVKHFYLCKDPQQLLKVYSPCFLRGYIKNKDLEGITKEFLSMTHPKQLYQKERMFNIRNQIKKRV